MIRFVAVAASAVLLAAASALAGSSGEPEYSDGNGVPSGQSQPYDQYAHGNGTLGTVNQSDMDRFLGDREQRASDARSDDDSNSDSQADIRGDTQEDSDAGPQSETPYASTENESTVDRSGDATVNAKVGRFNPSDFVALAGLHGPELVGVNLETKSGRAIGHVRNFSGARGHVASVTVDLDDGRSVKIGADKLRYNRKNAFLLTNLNQPELEQLAGE